jgi:hypothetical protein
MKSIVEVEINTSQKEAAALYADPHNNLKWRHDIACYESLSGEKSMPGSTYRLVPKQENMIFIATVIERKLPDELKLHLKALDVDVDVRGTFRSLPPSRTKLISEQIFTFNDADDETVSPSVKERRDMEGFKSFAENH